MYANVSQIIYAAANGLFVHKTSTIGNKCSRVKGHGKYMQMASLKSKFRTGIIGNEKNKVLDRLCC